MMCLSQGTIIGQVKWVVEWGGLCVFTADSQETEKLNRSLKELMDKRR
jgi:hypothetical protein